MHRLIIVAALLVQCLACSPDPETMDVGINIQISPAWSDDVTAVELLFYRYHSPLLDCAAVLDDPADSRNDLSCPSVATVCVLERKKIAVQPGSAGSRIEVPVGDTVLLGLGLDAGDSVVSSDCERFNVLEGQDTVVSLSL